MFTVIMFTIIFIMFIYIKIYILQGGRTALHYAAENGHGGVAEALLKAGCNKEMQTRSVRTQC